MIEEKTFTPNYIITGLKTKEEALKHIFEEFVQSPGCACADGTLTITIGTDFYVIKPKKRKKDDEI